MIGYYLLSNNEMCYSVKTQFFSPTKHTLNIIITAHRSDLSRENFIAEQGQGPKPHQKKILTNSMLESTSSKQRGESGVDMFKNYTKDGDRKL